MTTPHTVRRRTKVAVQRFVAHPKLKLAMRIGYVFRGLLYVTVGVLALGVAFGWQSNAEDLRGSLVLIPRGPIREILLPIFIVALTSYGLWGFIRAIWDPLKRGSDPAGLAARVGFLWSGANYLAIAVFAISFLIGANSGDGADGIFRLVNAVLAHPAGWVIIMIAGVIGTLAGLGQFFDAYKAGFRKDLKRNRMDRRTRVAVDSLGRFGMVARGVIFALLGWFILQAGLGHNAGRTQNMRQVFQDLAGAPLGHFLLSGIAVGFIALGLHSVALAWWVRMPLEAPPKPRKPGPKAQSRRPQKSRKASPQRRRA